MRVVFLEDVQGVALGGEVKEVKNGFARNYLIPKKLAVPASHDVLQRVERLKRQAGVTRLKELDDMKALAGELDGVRLDIEMRAGTGGRLYGSVTTAIVAGSISEITGRDIDRRTIAIPDSIRQLGVYEANVHLHPEVDAKVTLVIYAPGMEPDELVQQAEESQQADDGAPGDESDAETTDAPVAELAEADPDEASDEPADADEATAEASDEPADEASDEPADEDTDESDGDASDETAAEVSDETTAEDTDEPADEAGDETAAEVSDETAAEDTDEPADEASDETAAEVSDKTAAEDTDEPADADDATAEGSDEPDAEDSDQPADADDADAEDAKGQ